MRILVSVLLLLLFVPSWSGDVHLPLMGRNPSVTLSRVTLDPANAARRRVGALVWLGGVRLTSPDHAFGGFSALHVAGDRFTLLSDGGNLVRFRLDSRWRASDVRFADLRQGPGRGWEKKDRDSESLAIDPATGAAWVGFENSNELWRYDPGFTRALAHVAPPTMRNWPINGGAEAMTLLPGGGMVAIDETVPWAGGRGRAGIVFTGDPITAPRRGFRFGYVPPAGYDPSDMTVLPDGRLLVLNRAFALPLSFATKLTVIERAALKPGATVTGREIATLAAPLIHDNFEGVSVVREGNATIVWLVSDDNQLWLQRSLLLKFRLEPDPGARR